MPRNNTTNESPKPEVQEEPKAPEVQEEEYKEVFIHKASELDDPNDYVSINGKPFVIPKGKTVKVPAAVAAEIERSRRAQEKLDNKIDALVAKASK